MPVGTTIVACPTFRHWQVKYKIFVVYAFLTFLNGILTRKHQILRYWGYAHVPQPSCLGTYNSVGVSRQNNEDINENVFNCII